MSPPWRPLVGNPGLPAPERLWLAAAEARGTDRASSAGLSLAPSGHRSFTPVAEAGLRNPTLPAETPSKYASATFADPRWDHIGSTGLPTPRHSDARSQEGGKPRRPPEGFETAKASATSRGFRDRAPPCHRDTWRPRLPPGGFETAHHRVTETHGAPPVWTEHGTQLATVGAPLTAPHAHTCTPHCSCAKPIPTDPWSHGCTSGNPACQLPHQAAAFARGRTRPASPDGASAAHQGGRVVRAHERSHTRHTSSLGEMKPAPLESTTEEYH